MRLEAKKYLDDIGRASRQALEFAAGKDFATYAADPLLRSGIERQLEIVGEPIAQLARLDPQLAARIADYRRIISFRNILIHGYAEIDEHIVWDVVTHKLPAFARQAEALLREEERS